MIFPQVLPESSLTLLDCLCPSDRDSVWTMTSSFHVAPNTIDFNFVFATFDPKNIAVLITCIFFILASIPCMIVARRADQRDTQKVRSGSFLVAWSNCFCSQNLSVSPHPNCSGVFRQCQGTSLDPDISICCMSSLVLNLDLEQMLLWALKCVALRSALG